MESARTLARPDGASIAYRVSRAAAPRGTLVLLHGLASNLTRWWSFVAETRLAGRWNILRVDLRGHGGSLFRGRVGMQAWSDDLAAILAQETPGPAVLAGHCLGANLALQFAQRYPQTTAGLVLIEPMFRDALRGPLARAAQLRPLLQAAALVLRATAALGLHRRRLSALDLEQLDRFARAAMQQGAGAFPQERYSSPWEDLKTLPGSVYVQDLLAVTEALPPLAEIRAPTLALVSSGAAFTHPGLTARHLAVLPHCETLLLEARHWIPTEQPEAMRRAIDEWCLALEKPSA